MRRYIVLRGAQMILVMIGVTVLCFFMLKVTPGDPATAILGVQASPQEVERLRRSLGLDQPWFVQLGIWAGNVMRGDLGISYISKKPVSELILTRLPVTLELTIFSMLLAILIAIPAGIISAVKRNTWIDYFFTGFSLFGVSMPSFWFGILLILVFSLWLGWLPASGYVPLQRGIWPHFRSLILPGLALGLFLAGVLVRFSRASMVETLVQDYIRTARAKGLSNRHILLGHALRNALIPTVTIVGIQFGALLGGAVIIETVFAFPGVGTMLLTAVNQRDYPVVMGVTLVIALLYTITNLVVDFIYMWLNPRIRFG
ncbi:MAG: ABC transporter permease [Caldilinea sp.]|jgi:peptide/nickel transport system permease protein|uniref:ABC transporter permease n=1 Tax=Caldilinea sp. TaxID=2293560 RepID=UPI0030A95150